jgi:hypothetical protein
MAKTRRRRRPSFEDPHLTPAEEQARLRSREGYRKLARGAAIIFGLSAIAFFRGFVGSGRYLPFLVTGGIALVLALIAACLPDRPIPKDERADYDEGHRGSFPDGRGG